MSELTGEQSGAAVKVIPAGTEGSVDYRTEAAKAKEALIQRMSTRPKESTDGSQRYEPEPKPTPTGGLAAIDDSELTPEQKEAKKFLKNVISEELKPVFSELEKVRGTAVGVDSRMSERAYIDEASRVIDSVFSDENYTELNSKTGRSVYAAEAESLKAELYGGKPIPLQEMRSFVETVAKHAKATLAEEGILEHTKKAGRVSLTPTGTKNIRTEVTDKKYANVEDMANANWRELKKKKF